MAHMALTPAQRIASVLGGRSTLKSDVASPQALLRSIESGLPYTSFDALRERFGLSREDAAAAIGLPLRTLARRKRERRLHSDESDRLARVARVAAEAARILGDEQRAGLWLRDANLVLGGKRPIELVSSDLGARQVEDVLGRIEFGVYS